MLSASAVSGQQARQVDSCIRCMQASAARRLQLVPDSFESEGQDKESPVQAVAPWAPLSGVPSFEAGNLAPQATAADGFQTAPESQVCSGGTHLH